MVQKRVLVVDDDVDTANTFRALLEHASYEVYVAYAGADALSLAAAHSPDVALIDIGMPGIDGVEVCQRLRAMPFGGKMLLIAITGWSRDQDKRRALIAGFDHYFVKPVKFAHVLAVIAAA